MDIRLFLAFVVVVVASGIFIEEGSGPGSEVFIRIDPTDDFEWIKFKQTYNKTYRDPMEEAARRRNWEYNVKFVNKHNEEFLRGHHSFWVRIQAHSDMSQTELMNTKTGLILPKDDEEVYPPALTEPNLNLPNSVDWRDHKGVVTHVQDQGNCAACWAFAAAGALEGQCKIVLGLGTLVSEQNLVDCVPDTAGCRGGLTTKAYRYIQENGGVMFWFCYPYNAQVNTCLYDRLFQALSWCRIDCFVQRYENVGRSEHSLQEAVANVGPIAITVDIDMNQFSQYGGGVFDYPNCKTSLPNHAMVTVGYGNEGGKDYWLVKNSWGRGWGEEGYVKMRRNNNNQCGIASKGTYPVV